MSLSYFTPKIKAASVRTDKLLISTYLSLSIYLSWIILSMDFNDQWEIHEIVGGNIFPTQHSNLGQNWDVKVTGHDNLKLGQYCKSI